jgi:hypothetical protein
MFPQLVLELCSGFGLHRSTHAMLRLCHLLLTGSVSCVGHKQAQTRQELAGLDSGFSQSPLCNVRQLCGMPVGLDSRPLAKTAAFNPQQDNSAQ